MRVSMPQLPELICLVGKLLGFGACNDGRGSARQCQAVVNLVLPVCDVALVRNPAERIPIDRAYPGAEVTPLLSKILVRRQECDFQLTGWQTVLDLQMPELRCDWIWLLTQ